MESTRRCLAEGTGDAFEDGKALPHAPGWRLGDGLPPEHGERVGLVPVWRFPSERCMLFLLEAADPLTLQGRQS